MSWKRHFVEAVTLIGAAVLCALVANALARRERKLVLPGDYPDATKVRDAPPAPVAPPIASGTIPPSDISPKVTETGPTTAAGAAPGRSDVGGRPAVPTPKAPPKTMASRPAGEAKTPSSDLLKRFPPHPAKPWVEISGDDVAWLHARGALVLDARRTSVYEEGHIAGARLFPIWESDIDERVTALLNEGRDGSLPVVLYCSGGDCEDSHMLAQKLFGAGFDNLLVYRDGFPDWQKRGGESRTGPSP